MKRLVVIVEGETEEGFVNRILSPYFCSLGIFNVVQCFKTKHSNGGIAKYSYIKQDIINTIYESDVVVTTMIDFYRLPSNFPGYSELSQYVTHQEQADFLEKKMKEDIENVKERKFDNFIPYIQLHEFEALVFSSYKGIAALFDENEFDAKELERVIGKYSNPEDINNRPDTAPSVRLKKIIPGYNKVVYGIDILKEIGIETVLLKCPRFNKWVENLKKALE